jgi:hypothetical protein
MSRKGLGSRRGDRVMGWVGLRVVVDECCASQMTWVANVCTAVVVEEGI